MKWILYYAVELLAVYITWPFTLKSFGAGLFIIWFVLPILKPKSSDSASASHATARQSDTDLKISIS